MTSLCQRFGPSEDVLDPNVVKVVMDQNGHALLFSRSPIPFFRAAAVDHQPAGPYRHIGLYVQRREFLLRVAALEPTPLELAEALEQLRILEHGYSIKMVETRHDSIGVDTPEDLARVRRLLTANAPA
jgi:3-deoxy-manno-octulosonate cytidylyltransferase (CMP-KDO synthetase)